SCAQRCGIVAWTSTCLAAALTNDLRLFCGSGTLRLCAIAQEDPHYVGCTKFGQANWLRVRAANPCIVLTTLRADSPRMQGSGLAPIEVVEIEPRRNTNVAACKCHSAE